MNTKKLPYITPGEILSDRLAKDIGVPGRRINEIVHGKRAITTDTAYRLAQYFGTSPQFWINAQILHDLDVLKREGKLPIVPRCKMLVAA